MLFGNGLSALMTLMMISGLLVVLFILGPMALSGRQFLGSGWPAWLLYFGLLGAGFMLVEVALLQRFVLLLGHPVYSLHGHSVFTVCWARVSGATSVDGLQTRTSAGARSSRSAAWRRSGCWRSSRFRR